MDEKVKARFWSKVLVGSKDECWPWNGCGKKSRYGILSVSEGGKRRNKLAHRISYEIHNGSLPRSVNGVGGPTNVVMHLCHNRNCVNPHHLALGDNDENLRQTSDLRQANPKLYRPGNDLPSAVVRDIRRNAGTFEGVCKMMLKYRLHENRVVNIYKRKSYSWVD